MGWLQWVSIIILGVILFPFILISWTIYSILLLRLSKKKWSRRESMPKDLEYANLYGEALSWRQKYLSHKKDVEITNDHLHLFGEYFQFNSDKAVIIIPGRMEACNYSCQYAEPYRKAGWNILTIDNRAHGNSDGHINSIGYKEYRDVLAWARYLHEKENIQQIVLHGICIGSSTAVFTATDSSCPPYIIGIVVDGLYQRFYDSCVNHMKNSHRPVYPFIYGIMLFTKWISKADAIHDGPVYRIRNLKKPILFLHSKEDRFSTPQKLEEIYAMCPSSQKTLHWFEHGEHSRVRFTNPVDYDQAIHDYLSTICSSSIKMEKCI